MTGTTSGIREASPPYLVEPPLSQSGISSKTLLQVLGGNVGVALSGTLSYRWRGEDTLTLGDPARWVEVSWIRCLVAQESSDACVVQSGSVRELMSEARLRTAFAVYRTCEEGRVGAFLRVHPEAQDDLMDAYPHIARLFGLDTELNLDLVQDPEIEGPPSLLARICTNLPVDEAIERLDLFDDWHVRRSSRARESLLFDIEFL